MCSKKRSNSFCMRVHSPRIAVVPTDSQQNLQPARYSQSRASPRTRRATHVAFCSLSLFLLSSTSTKIYSARTRLPVGRRWRDQPRPAAQAAVMLEYPALLKHVLQCSKALRARRPGRRRRHLDPQKTCTCTARVKAHHGLQRAGSAAHARSASASSPSGTGPKWCCASSLLRDRPPKRGHPALAQARAPSG